MIVFFIFIKPSSKKSAKIQIPTYQEIISYKNAQDIFTKGLQPQVKPGQNSKGENKNNDLNSLPENARDCVIEKISEAKWNDLINHQRPARVQEEQIISECISQ